MKYLLIKKLFIDLRQQEREGKKEGGREEEEEIEKETGGEREALICCSTYLFIYWLILVYDQGLNPQTWNIRTTSNQLSYLAS